MLEAETVVTATSLKISVPREELTRQLGIVSRAASTRSTVQVLAGILLRAEGGRLELAATDMEISLRSSVEVSVESEGAVVVPSKLLADLVRLLPGDEVTIEQRAGEGIVEIVSGAATYRLNTYNAEDFPRLPETAGVELMSVNANAVLETAGRVSRAASRDESRPVLTGILVRFEGEKLVMAATDSYRLAVKETATGSGGPELDAIVPARSLAELSRIAQGTGDLEIGVLENQVVFSTDGVLLTTRRIEGQFPNYRQLLPESFEHELTLQREELLDVVRRVSVMAQRNAPIRLRFAEGELTVSAQTQDVGEARETMPAPYAAEPLEIGFNPEFLRDGLESIDGDEVRLKLISPLRPAVIQGEGDDFSYLIMPIRLAG
ncbi:MAG TPA: DNA polymerase III subunit beta [Gaiellaceae bacterium]|jgi:DNA polymerase-3 subunit beta|nr:DNA polymerase III subunit beta [Gaiellaceae bacterium]